MALETSIRHVPNVYHKKSNGMEIKTIPSWLDGDALEIASSTDKKSHKKGTIVSSTEHFLIEEFIKSKLDKAYKKSQIKAVTRYEDGNLLIKTTSRHCMNLGREHNSCGIYFFATPDGLYQKCLCPCMKLKDRKVGYCRDYTSDCHINLLFPLLLFIFRNLGIN